MGGIPSSLSTTENPNPTETIERDPTDTMIFVHIFPHYYLHDAVIDSNDIESVRTSWASLIDGSCANYANLGVEMLFANPTCIQWFANVFYNRFFEILPHAKVQFGNLDMNTQGKKLVDMISASVKLLDDSANLVQILQKLAEQCLGTAYNEQAWLKVYSIMLRSLVPAAYVLESQLRKEAGGIRRKDLISAENTARFKQIMIERQRMQQQQETPIQSRIVQPRSRSFSPIRKTA